MTKQKTRRMTLRRKVESAGVTVVAVAAAATIASRGPLMTPNDGAPMTRILATQTPAAAPMAKLAARDASLEIDLPNLDHASVDKWIARYTGSMKPSIEKYIERIDQYDDMIAAKAEAKGLPKDLVYLAMIESGGVANAKSPVGARGLWQFMAPTAKQYKLTVRGKNDERMNPELATDAALDYLGDLYKRFGSWYLAAAAYNTGQGRIARLMKQETGRTKGTDADFYRIAPRLSQETRDYVPKLIAAARIAKDPAKYGVDVPAQTLD